MVCQAVSVAPDKPIVRANGEWILPVSRWECWHNDDPCADGCRELGAGRWRTSPSLTEEVRRQ